MPITPAYVIADQKRRPVLWVLHLQWEGLIAGCDASGAQRMVEAVAQVIDQVDSGMAVPTEQQMWELLDKARLGTPESRVEERVGKLSVQAIRGLRRWRPGGLRAGRALVRGCLGLLLSQCLDLRLQGCQV